MVGALLLGYFVTRLQERLPPSSYRRPLLGTGLCGALTTFATLQLELFEMLEAGHLGARRRLRRGDARRRLRLRPPGDRDACGGRGWCGERSPPGSGSPCSAGWGRWRASCSTRRLPRARPGRSPSARSRSTSAAPRRSAWSPGAPLHGTALTIVAGGGLGSYTTFSTWMFESQRLGEAGRATLLWLNIGLSLLAGLAAVSLGHWLGGVL